MNFTEFYQKHADAIYSFLLFRLQDRYLAQDILQDIFLAVYQSLEKKLDIKNEKAWLFSIARHKIADYYRKNNLDEQQLITEAIPAKSNECDSHLTLQEMLTQLHPIEQTIIYGLYVEGFNQQELAEILKIPHGTVKSKAFYARQKLKKWLKEES